MNEKRHDIACPRCGEMMVFTKTITPPIEGVAGLIFRCPTRDQEHGCGYIKEVLINISQEGQEIVI